PPVRLADHLAIESKKLGVSPPHLPPTVKSASASGSRVSSSVASAGLGLGTAASSALGLSPAALSPAALSPAALSPAALSVSAALSPPALSPASLLNDVSVVALSQRLERVERALEALLRQGKATNGAAEHAAHASAPREG